MRGYKERFKAERTLTSPQQYEYFSKRRDINKLNTYRTPPRTLISNARAEGTAEALVENATSDLGAMTLADVVKSGTYTAIPTTDEMKALIPSTMERQARLK